MGIEDAVKKVRDRITASAAKAGRDPAGIRLVAVSKTVEPERIIEAVKAGVAILGENRVQEAREKIPEIASLSAAGSVEWHLIGHLQKNKARTAVMLFDLIHSVDSVALAVELNKQAGKTGKIQDVLVQVKLSGEAA
ncbi:MAG: YggS family pyridoxal phosphate-dependent enzyme, partial [Deferribacteres bacterium]|nr:YggS family pyridoxal phosphate-dependent enzyme [Deferribacteres bacterium]